MNSAWLSARNDIFIRAVFEDFFDSRQRFSSIDKGFRESGRIDYALLDALVGTDTRKGHLWKLKDLSHTLFRTSDASVRLHEHLFDWTLSTVFHEMMKIKESAYQIELYDSLRRICVAHPGQARALERLIGEYDQLLAAVQSEIVRGLERVKELFEQAHAYVCEIALHYRTNMLLVRLLLDHQDAAGAPHAMPGIERMIGSMFPGGMSDAYTAVARDCLNRGWCAESLGYCTRALEHNPRSREAAALLKKLQKIISCTT